jgi:predicted DNA-binding transcriptional regulator YafY
VEPHGLVARDGRWYLAAWDLAREDWRVFRLDRTTPRRPLGPPFAPRPIPAGDARTFVAARFKGATDRDEWPCVGEVEIRLPAHRVAPWIVDGEVEAVSSDACRVRIGSWSWTGLLAAVLRFDADLRIVGPDELVAAADGLARRLAAARPGPQPEP